MGDIEFTPWLAGKGVFVGTHELIPSLPFTFLGSELKFHCTQESILTTETLLRLKYSLPFVQDMESEEREEAYDNSLSRMDMLEAAYQSTR